MFPVDVWSENIKINFSKSMMCGVGLGVPNQAVEDSAAILGCIRGSFQ